MLTPLGRRLPALVTVAAPGALRLDLRPHPAGVYLIRIVTPGNQTTRRVLPEQE